MLGEVISFSRMKEFGFLKPIPDNGESDIFVFALRLRMRASWCPARRCCSKLANTTASRAQCACRPTEKTRTSDRITDLEATKMDNETSRIAELKDRVELLERMVTELRAERYGRGRETPAH